MKIIVKIDINKDAANWWHACNKVSYGIDWKQRITKILQNKVVNKTEKQAYSFLVPYLKKLYKREKIEEIQKQLQKMFNSRAHEIFRRMVRVTGKKIYRKSFTIFLTTFSRAPYDPKRGFVWMPIQRGERSMNTFTHELLHFQTLYYYEKLILKKLNENEKENLKEALTVILNVEFKDLLTWQPDYGYPIHKFLREDLFWFWKKHRNFNRLISHGISVYPKYAKTIRYLGFGIYTSSCPEFLLDKVKRLKSTRISNAYVYKVLRAIKEEFDPRLHTTTTTNDFKTSRFISIKEILNKRQRSCGSLATVVASALRNFGIPAKLIDGKFIKNNPKMRHAWNEIWVNDKWVSFDVMRKDFSLTQYHIKLGEYVDWEELEDNKDG